MEEEDIYENCENEHDETPTKRQEVTFNTQETSTTIKDQNTEYTTLQLHGGQKNNVELKNKKYMIWLFTIFTLLLFCVVIVGIPIHQHKTSEILEVKLESFIKHLNNGQQESKREMDLHYKSIISTLQNLTRLNKIIKGHLDCPYSYKRSAHLGHCYHSNMKAELTYDDAVLYCANHQGGHIVNIATPSKQADVDEYFKENGLDAEIWLGLINQNEKWVWKETLKEVSWSNWQAKQPNGDGECSRIKIRTGYWLDGQCTATNYYLCEI